MHWVRGEPGGFDYEREIFLVRHPPSEIVFISAADTELVLAERCWRPTLGERLEIVHATPLRQPVAADAYVDETLRKCGLVIARLLGGSAYFPHFIDALTRLREEGTSPKFLLLDGATKLDEELAELSDFDDTTLRGVFSYFTEGGRENFSLLLSFLEKGELAQPVSTPSVGLYREKNAESPKGIVWVLFYRAWVQADDLEVVDSLCEDLAESGLSAKAIYVFSLRDPAALKFLNSQEKPEIILTLLSFSAGEAMGKMFAHWDVPVLQVATTAMARSDWREPNTSLIPAEVAMNIALPEIDGRVMSTVVGFKEDVDWHQGENFPIKRLRIDREQVRFVARQTKNWVRLKSLNSEEKRIAVILSNYPNKDGRIGNGVGLDTPASAVKFLRVLSEKGYILDHIPENGDQLMDWLQQGVTNDAEQSYGRPYFQSSSTNVADTLTRHRKKQVEDTWGQRLTTEIPVPGIPLGNVFVGIQPKRGHQEQTQSIYHSPELAPTHEYLAFYHWIREDFRADAIVQIGKHGNVEWLPGRSTGLGADDFPQHCMGTLPFLYAFIVNNPGEGAQAKRRNSAVIVDHLTPPLARAGLYEDLQKMERLLEEFAHAATLYPKRQEELEREIMDLLERASWKDEIPDEEDKLSALDNFLCEIKESQIRSGLHILGESPKGERLLEMLSAILRSHGFFEALFGKRFDWEDLSATERDSLHAKADGWLRDLVAGNEVDPLNGLDALARYRILPPLQECEREIESLLRGLEGRFIEPGPAGAPTRGRRDVLPTGRNFYSLDPRTVPTETAWRCGKKMADALLERHRQEHGEYPKTVAMVVWGTSNMRTGGDDLAQALWLWGCEPVWDEDSGRVVDFRILPASTLARPRVDVLLRISGLFRDAFGETMRMLAAIPKRIAELDEPAELNPIRAAYLKDLAEWKTLGYMEEQAQERAYLRVFSSPPGSYGAGLLPLIDSGKWESQKDLSDVFCRWGNHAYDSRGNAIEDEALLRGRLEKIEAVHQNQDNREHDILDSDDYFQFHGGLHAAITAISGQEPNTFHGDSSVPDRPKVRTLREEFVRVLRSRVLNPKWIEAMRQHGYKGAFEIAASIDYLYGYDATTGVADSHHYDEVAQKLLLDPTQLDFFRKHNPHALKESCERLFEAHERGLWEAPDEGSLDALREVYSRSMSELE